MRLFLSGLPFFVQDRDLAQRFSLPTEAVHVARDHRRDRSLGYGFINLPTDAARLLLDQGVFAWGGRTVSVRGARAEAAELVQAAHESGPAQCHTKAAGNGRAWGAPGGIPAADVPPRRHGAHSAARVRG